VWNRSKSMARRDPGCRSAGEPPLLVATRAWCQAGSGACSPDPGHSRAPTCANAYQHGRESRSRLRFRRDAVTGDCGRLAVPMRSSDLPPSGTNSYKQRLAPHKVFADGAARQRLEEATASYKEGQTGAGLKTLIDVRKSV